MLMMNLIATIWSVVATAGLPMALAALALSALVEGVRARRAEHEL